MPPTTNYLTLPELAEALGLSERTIRRAVKAGLPCHRLMPGSQRLFVLAEVRAHMQNLGDQTPGASQAPARRKRKLRVPAEVTERLRAQGFKV